VIGILTNTCLLTLKYAKPSYSKAPRLACLPSALISTVQQDKTCSDHQPPFSNSLYIKHFPSQAGIASTVNSVRVSSFLDLVPLLSWPLTLSALWMLDEEEMVHNDTIHVQQEQVPARSVLLQIRLAIRSGEIISHQRENPEEVDNNNNNNNNNHIQKGTHDSCE